MEYVLATKSNIIKPLLKPLHENIKESGKL